MESLDFNHISSVFQCNNTLKNTSHLKEILLDTLKQFNISKQQVLACVVDNASNMTRTVQLLNENEGDKENDEEIEEIQDSLSSTDHTIYHTRCAEHTLQLGICDVLKKGRAEKFLTKLQKLAQHLCSPHADGILKHHANKLVLVDMPTYWGSTFLMLQQLADLKCFVQYFRSQESYLYLTESEWAEVKMMVDICSTQRSPVDRVQMHGVSNRDTHLYPPHSTSVHLTTYVGAVGGSPMECGVGRQSHKPHAKSCYSGMRLLGSCLGKCLLT